MNEKTNRRIDLLSKGISAVVLTLFFIYIYQHYAPLPDRIAIHFDLNGNPNGYAAKHWLWGMYGINYLVLVLLAVFHYIPTSILYKMNLNSSYKDNPSKKPLSIPSSVIILLTSSITFYCVYRIISFHL